MLKRATMMLALVLVPPLAQPTLLITTIIIDARSRRGDHA
jgi:hypothetical protein